MRRNARSLAWLTAAAVLVAAVAEVVFRVLAQSRGIKHSFAPEWEVFYLAGVLSPAVVGLGVALRRPGNRVAWILLFGSLFVAVVMAAVAIAGLALLDDRDSVAGRWAALISQEWPCFFAWPLALAFLFPDGRLPSRRWRLPAAFAAVSTGGMILLLFFGSRDLTGGFGHATSPLPWVIGEGVGTVLFWSCFFGFLVSLISGVACVRARYRTGSEDVRRQVLWLAYGVLLLPIWFGGTALWGLVVGDSGESGQAVLMVVQAWLAVAVAVAVSRHGLYQIDRLISRTVAFVVLTALLAGTYAAGVTLAGLAVGRGSAAAAALATAIAALAFGPLRRRVQRAVDRRFARARFEAVALIRGFIDDVHNARAEPEDVGAALAVALGDPTAEVVFRLPETAAYADREGRLLPALPDDGRVHRPVLLGERELGVLLHDPVVERNPDLLRAVLAAAAVAVELARLRVELRLQLAAVEFSRARIAQAGYEERRRLERDLHDGAQQRLVTLGIVLRRLQRSLPREALVLVPALDAAVDEVSAAINDLRTIAAGVRPPRLDQGLAAALTDLARGATVPVELHATPDRAPPDVEVTAYFVACEALTNAIKHASSSGVQMHSTREDGVLRLVIADDGVGGARASGGGLTGLTDRVAAQGGTVQIVSAPGAGTRIAVELPCVS
jgi:signal transduction histidine kinase